MTKAEYQKRFRELTDACEYVAHNRTNKQWHDDALRALMHRVGQLTDDLFAELTSRP